LREAAPSESPKPDFTYEIEQVSSQRIGRLRIRIRTALSYGFAAIHRGPMKCRRSTPWPLRWAEQPGAKVAAYDDFVLPHQP